GSGATTTNSARITGMYFYHPDHLGSITMITDGRGNVLAGGERGGKSHITYRPYGEILRTDSYGPDISKYKYTGQEEDRESGLIYYKARYYDAKIGRFLQQDSMAFPNQVNGMNRMMYVEGNPVGYRDPSGNYNTNNLLTDITKYLITEIVSNSKDPLFSLFVHTAGNKALYKTRNNKGSSFQRSDLGKIYNHIHPLNVLGFMFAVTNYVAGKLLQRDTKIKKVDGGYVVQGGPLMPAGSGITLGSFAVAGGTDEATLRHEAAHIKQYKENGPEWYMQSLGSSPIKNLSSDNGVPAENDADRRAGTFSYGASSRVIDNLYYISLLRMIQARTSQERIKNFQDIIILRYYVKDIGYIP
ncbi:MAG: RHS repeat-associated core domain-containing protein, partial [Leptospiraceae bacterium]|nr:RHS repeat-associated core domain-containing protein [Leptospiraceae bacterium]